MHIGNYTSGILPRVSAFYKQNVLSGRIPCQTVDQFGVTRDDLELQPAVTAEGQGLRQDGIRHGRAVGHAVSLFP